MIFQLQGEPLYRHRADCVNLCQSDLCAIVAKNLLALAQRGKAATKDNH
jgi:hypothetical protein